MPNTPLHAIPYPLGSDAPNAPSQLQALATQVDNALPIVQTATPTNLMGRLWRNPTNGVTQLGDGSAWAAIGGAPPSRIRFTRSANLGGGLYTGIGTPAANNFLTATELSSPNNLTRFTVTQQCMLWISVHAVVSVSPTGNAYLRLVYPPTASGPATRGASVSIVSYGGSVYEGLLTYSGLFTSGETFDIFLRNWSTSTLWAINSSITAQAIPAADFVGTQT